MVQSVRSVDDVYNIFDHITSSLDLPCESQHIVPVPISVACAKKQNELYGIPYNTERIEKIRTAVAQRIYTAIVEDKVNYLLLSGDYMFPVATRSMFNALFIESLGEFPNPEEAFQKTCYISGDSPAIFLYAKNSLASIVEPVSSVAYTHPVLTTNRWETITKKNTVVVNGMPYDYLYYEYDGTKVQFREPKEGYVVKKTEWKKVAETIASQIGLNDKEKQALFTDIQNALPKVQTPYMKISIVNEQEVAEKLPLNISPTPDTIRRIHLLLSPQRATPKPAVPVFSPIVRNDFTIVEVGVAVGK